jgi:hypothetical protein
MHDEEALRTTSFEDATRVRLADGQVWSLPTSWTAGGDPESDALLEEVFAAEDEAGRLQAELALTLFALSRNYRLTAHDYQELLGFAPGDTRLGELQQAVHEMVLQALSEPRSAVVQRHKPPPRSSVWGLVGQFYHALRFRLLGRIP